MAIVALNPNISGPIFEGSKFYWEEVTRGGKRPINNQQAEMARRLAEELMPYRTHIGKPFNVLSWYRPPHINAAVGGSPNSYHLQAGAVDFFVTGMSGYVLASNFLDWNGGLGVYHNRIHCDIGPKRRWRG